MKLKKDRDDEIVSILAEGVVIDGELSFDRGLRVDGTVRGKIDSESFLIIGPGGKVEAEVRIRRASINGEFRGAIHAADRVEIHRDGKVFGDIFTPCLIIELGATFDGRCNMSDQKGAGEKAAAAPEPQREKAEGDGIRKGG